MRLPKRVRKISRKLYIILATHGIDPVKMIRSILGYPRYIKNFYLIKKSINEKDDGKKSESIKKFGMPYPITSEFNSQAGNASGHYFHQDLITANQIYKENPEIHLDIGSRIDGFIAHLLSFEQKTVLGDVRPVNIDHPNIKSILIDITKEVNGKRIHQYKSISCLHALEHMGLGRYGDPIDARGHYKALKHLNNLLVPEGTLYLSYPTGENSRIEYNAHRVISLAESKRMFDENQLEVKKFAYVDDNRNLIKVEDLKKIDWEKSYGLEYGCAIWTLEKRPSKGKEALSTST